LIVGVGAVRPDIRGSFDPPYFAPEPSAVLAGELELKGCSEARRVPAGGLGAGVVGEGVGFGLGDFVGEGLGFGEVGEGLGVLVGFAVGDGFGFFVGFAVGLVVGSGLAVGWGSLGADFVVVGAGVGLAGSLVTASLALGGCEVAAAALASGDWERRSCASPRGSSPRETLTASLRLT